MKIKTYKLKDLAYMSLSINYIFALLALMTTTLILVAIYSFSQQWIKSFLVIVIGGSSIFYIYNIGIKYGAYGLVILVSKFFQPKQIKNDFPIIGKHLVVKTTSTNKK